MEMSDYIQYVWLRLGEMQNCLQELRSRASVDLATQDPARLALFDKHALRAWAEIQSARNTLTYKGA